MAGVKGRRATAGIFPYNPLKREWKKTSKTHSEHDRAKTRTVADSGRKKNQELAAKSEPHYRKLLAMGVVTRRKTDGSYYIVGDLEEIQTRLDATL